MWYTFNEFDIIKTKIKLLCIKVVRSYYEHLIYIVSLDLDVCRNSSANLLLIALAILLLLSCLLVTILSVFLLLLFELPTVWYGLLVELLGMYLPLSILIKASRLYSQGWNALCFVSSQYLTMMVVQFSIAA